MALHLDTNASILKYIYRYTHMHCNKRKIVERFTLSIYCWRSGCIDLSTTNKDFICCAFASYFSFVWLFWIFFRHWKLAKFLLDWNLSRKFIDMSSNDWKHELKFLMDFIEEESTKSLEKINRNLLASNIPFDDEFRENIRKMMDIR